MDSRDRRTGQNLSWTPPTQEIAHISDDSIVSFNIHDIPTIQNQSKFEFVNNQQST